MVELTGNPEFHHRDWPLRPWILAALLAGAGLAIHLFTDGAQESALHMAGAGFSFFAALAVALTLGPDDWKEPALFSLLVGLVMGGLAYRAVDAGNHVAGEEFGFAAGVVAFALAVPLFEAGFRRDRLATSYRLAHFHAWSDAVSGALALAFTGLSWLVLVLLDALFRLVEIKLIGELMKDGWFGWTFSGLAFGASLGVLRNQLKVLGTLQSVAMLVLSLLAVPLALALVVFLVPLAMSGGQVLWDATRSPTPVLLACAAGACLLANAVVRDDDAASSPNRFLRLAAVALALGILPLTIFAVISLGARVSQHGLSPERIWGLIAVGVAVLCALAYWLAVLRGGLAMWRARLRETNLRLAAGVCVLALLLSLPLFDFGAISTRNQLARLESGAVSAEEFDYAALRWDFGNAGRKALADLAKRPDKAISEPARLAQASINQYDRYGPAGSGRIAKEIVTYPAGFALPKGLREAIIGETLCRGETVCRIYLQSDPKVVAVLSDPCSKVQPDQEEDCLIRVEAFILDATGAWRAAPFTNSGPNLARQGKQDAHRKERAAIETGKVYVAPAKLRQVYIGEQPTGRMFE